MAEIVTISNEEYHKNRDRVSPSRLKCLLESPQEYCDRFVTETTIVPPTAAMILGSALDARVFEPSSYDSLFRVCPDGRSAKGKDARAQCFIDGVLPITEDQDENAKAMAEAVRANPLFRIAVENPDAQRQLTIYHEDLMTGEPMQCRLDLWVPQPDEAFDLIVDLKSACDPHPSVWMNPSDYNPICKLHYDVQLVSYDLAVQSVKQRPCALALFVVGSSAPHDTISLNLREYYQRGYEWRQYALWLLGQCRRSGVWQHPEQQKVLQPAPSKWTRMPSYPDSATDTSYGDGESWEME